MIDKYLTADIIDNDALAVDMQKDEEVQVDIPQFVAIGGAEDLNDVLTEQEGLIAELQDVLKGKASGGTPIPTQEKEIDITENGTVEVAPDEGYAMSKVTANVNVPIPEGYIVPSGTKAIAENGKHDVTEYASVDVNVQASGDGEIVDSLIDRSITEISSDITVIGYYAFSNCAELVNVNFPNVVTINGYGFQNCSSIKSVSFPKVQGVNGYAFYGCTSLENVDFPSIRTVGNYAFRKCETLTKIDLRQTYNINVYAFYECTNLETIILRKTDKPCTLAATNVIQKTKIEDGVGYIYVPAALMDSYKTATNWSTYAAQFRAIEDYPEICGGEA